MAFWNDDIETVKTSLDIDENVAIQKAGWKFQRAGLFFILLMVLLAAVGLFGDGFVSKRTLRQKNASVEYERFFRHQAPMKLTVQITGKPSGTIISFPATYINDFNVHRVVPEPATHSVVDGQVRFEFANKGELSVTFYLEPEHVGHVDGFVRVGEQSFMIHHFIFP